MRIRLPFLLASLLLTGLLGLSPVQGAENPFGLQVLETDHFILLSETKPDAQVGRFAERVWTEVAKNVEDMDVAFREVTGGNKIAIFLYTKPGAYAAHLENLFKPLNMPPQQLQNLQSHVGTRVQGGLAFNMAGRKAEEIHGPIAHLLSVYLLSLRLHHAGAPGIPDWLQVAFAYTIEMEMMKKPSIRYASYTEGSSGDAEIRTADIFTDENWAGELRNRVRKGTTMGIYTANILSMADLNAESVAFLYSLGRYLTSTPDNRKKFNAFLRLYGEKPNERTAVLLLEAFGVDNTQFERDWMNFIKGRNFR